MLAIIRTAATVIAIWPLVNFCCFFFTVVCRMEFPHAAGHANTPRRTQGSVTHMRPAPARLETPRPQATSPSSAPANILEDTRVPCFATGPQLQPHESRTPIYVGNCLFLAGTAMVLYLSLAVAPFTPDGQDDIQAIGLMFLGLFMTAGGVGTLLAHKLHQQWPGMRGHGSRDVSLRQGLLLGLAVCLMGVMALFDLLDFAVAGSILFLIGLLETFLQNRTEAA